MSRFNFNDINLNSRADITEIIDNFNKIEENGALLEDVNTKAPINHSSTERTYGVATNTNYGHTRIIDNLTTGSYTEGHALSAYQGKVLSDMISVKVDKVTGKGLSTNDYTNTEKEKLAGISPNANNYSLPIAGSSLGGVKTTSTVSNNSGYTACPIISGVVYYKDTNTTYNNATTSASGLMSNTDKSKLDGIATGATKNVISTGTANPSGGSNGDIYIQYF